MNDHKEKVNISDLDKKLDMLYSYAMKNFEAHFKSLLAIQSDIANIIEQRRKENIEKEEVFQERLFKQSIILGFGLGLFGNLLVSYFMKTIEPLVGWWTYLIATAFGFISMLILIYALSLLSIYKTSNG